MTSLWYSARSSITSLLDPWSKFFILRRELCAWSRTEAIPSISLVKQFLISTSIWENIRTVDAIFRQVSLLIFGALGEGTTCTAGWGTGGSGTDFSCCISRCKFVPLIWSFLTISSDDFSLTFKSSFAEQDSSNSVSFSRSCPSSCSILSFNNSTSAVWSCPEEERLFCLVPGLFFPMSSASKVMYVLVTSSRS